MIATGGIVGLAEGIIDDTCLAFLFVSFITLYISTPLELCSTCYNMNEASPLKAFTKDKFDPDISSSIYDVYPLIHTYLANTCVKQTCNQKRDIVLTA